MDGSRRKTQRKGRQLGRQIAETLDQAFATQRDGILSALHVVAVEPAPDTSRLLVTVGTLPSEELDPLEVIARLEAASGRLRSEVAAAITRKRVPVLVYRVAVRRPQREQRS
jgi:ribosome-binding factor A